MGYQTDEYYDQQYAEKVKELAQSVKDNDLKDVTFQEMARLRYKPSDDPERDAELNFTKAQLAASRAVRFDSGCESYLRYRARETGKTLSEARAWARRVLKNSEDDDE